MERRELIKQVFVPDSKLNEEVKKSNSSKLRSNLRNNKLNLTQIYEINASLDKYEGDWTRTEAAHLLRRTTMGHTKQQLDEVIELGMVASIEKLLTFKPQTTYPINFNNPQDTAPVGTTWVNEKSNIQNEIARIQSLLAWWFGLMMDHGLSITDKLTLFWHNHFVTEIDIVLNGRASYSYLKLLRDNSLGNFKELVEKITLEPAMLAYLNGDSNTGRAPNENYARELFELFTIGKGPQIANGDYTNYTESDILAAAKVLSGWVIDRLTGTASFRRGRHDLTTKQFSYIYGNATIKNNNELEYKDLINLIFAHKDSTKHIVRKLYRWFVNYEITEKIEKNIIEPLAQMMKESNFEIKPVIQKLLESKHFYDIQTIGSHIKNPLEYAISFYNLTAKTGQYDYGADYSKQYNFWLNYGVALGVAQEMFLGDPPSVAGWQAYYQSQNFYQLWINSVSLSFRNSYSDIITAQGINRGGLNINVDVFSLVDTVCKTPENPVDLVRDMTNHLLPIQLTESQQMFLKLFLVPEGFEDFVWTQDWVNYIANPRDTQAKAPIEQKLKVLIAVIIAMPEFQLN